MACEVFRDEFEAVTPAEMPRTYLPQGLHRTPGKMPAAIQEVVDVLPADTDTVILGYGLCSNGVVGVTARQAALVIPKVHDCIAVLLGSVQRYESENVFFQGSQSVYIYNFVRFTDWPAQAWIRSISPALVPASRIAAVSPRCTGYGAGFGASGAVAART